MKRFIALIIFAVFAAPAFPQEASLDMTQKQATAFAKLALKGIQQEYPNKPGTVLNSKADIKGPRDFHPAFYGSFDWHSSVHAYWMLALLRRRFAGLAEAGAIAALFDRQLTEAKVAVEVAYAQRYPGFERPYGWAWVLMLTAELADDATADGRRWAACHPAPPCRAKTTGLIYRRCHSSPPCSRRAAHACCRRLLAGLTSMTRLA